MNYITDNTKKMKAGIVGLNDIIQNSYISVPIVGNYSKYELTTFNDNFYTETRKPHFFLDEYTYSYENDWGTLSAKFIKYWHSLSSIFGRYKFKN